MRMVPLNNLDVANGPANTPSPLILAPFWNLESNSIYFIGFLYIYLKSAAYNRYSTVLACHHLFSCHGRLLSDLQDSLKTHWQNQ
jgi:hypothetical protein